MNKTLVSFNFLKHADQLKSSSFQAKKQLLCFLPFHHPTSQYFLPPFANLYSMSFPKRFSSRQKSPKLRKGAKIVKKFSRYSVDPVVCPTREEVKQLLKAAHIRKQQGKTGIKDWMFIVLGLNTGLRISEIAHLSCAHVVSRGAFYPHIFVEHGKTPHSRRIVPLNDRAVKAVGEYLEYKRLWDEPTTNNAPFLRPPSGQGYYSRSGLYAAFRRVLSLCTGIEKPERFHPHSTRHAFSSHLYEATKDLKLVSELLGHSSVEVTAQMYISIFASQKIEAVQKLYL